MIWREYKDLAGWLIRAGSCPRVLADVPGETDSPDSPDRPAVEIATGRAAPHAVARPGRFPIRAGRIPPRVHSALVRRHSPGQCHVLLPSCRGKGGMMDRKSFLRLTRLEDR